jgi:hypothetical protein
MRVRGIHWLDYDPVALVVLVLGISSITMARFFADDPTVKVSP